MEIIYTKHALKKFVDLKALGVAVSKIKVSEVLNKPLLLDRESDYPNIIATGKLDVRHVLRVVYREEGGRILIVTFYPGEGARYL